MKFQRRGLFSNLQQSVSPSLKIQVLQIYGSKCHYCGKYLTYDYSHIDHATPRAKGGLTVVNNLRASCPPCNLEKGDKNENEYIFWKLLKNFNPNRKEPLYGKI